MSWSVKRPLFGRKPRTCKCAASGCGTARWTASARTLRSRPRGAPGLGHSAPASGIRCFDLWSRTGRTFGRRLRSNAQRYTTAPCRRPGIRTRLASAHKATLYPSSPMPQAWASEPFRSAPSCSDGTIERNSFLRTYALALSRVCGSNSLLTGKLTGNFTKIGPFGETLPVRTAESVSCRTK
jgi:hypothetical protein